MYLSLVLFITDLFSCVYLPDLILLGSMYPELFFRQEKEDKDEERQKNVFN